MLLNISRSKGNQITTFGQLIEYNMINIFLKKSCIKCEGKASLRPFYEESILSISLDQHLECCKVCFLLYLQVEVYENELKLRS